MANEILRQQLLTYLSNIYETQGPRPANMQEFCKQNSISFEQIQPILEMLYHQGVIDTVVGHGSAKITKRGYEIFKPSDPCVPKSGGTHVNFNAPVNGAAVAIDRSSASATNISVINENILQKYADILAKTEGVPEEKKDGWIATLNEMSRHPIAVEAFKLVLANGLG